MNIINAKINFNYLKIAKNVAIISFIIISLIKLLYSSFYSNEAQIVYMVRIISAFIYSLLGYLTYKDRLIPSIIMAVSLLLFGLGSIAEGYFIIKMATLLRIVMVIAGSLFVLGGLSIISIVRRKMIKTSQK